LWRLHCGEGERARAISGASSRVLVVQQADEFLALAEWEEGAPYCCEGACDKFGLQLFPYGLAVSRHCGTVAAVTTTHGPELVVVPPNRRSDSTLVLPLPFPLYYLAWLPCGTRLTALGVFDSEQRLVVIDLAAALVEGNKAAERLPPLHVKVLASCAPLFYAVHDSRPELLMLAQGYMYARVSVEPEPLVPRSSAWAGADSVLAVDASAMGLERVPPPLHTLPPFLRGIMSTPMYTETRRFGSCWLCAWAAAPQGRAALVLLATDFDESLAASEASLSPTAVLCHIPAGDHFCVDVSRRGGALAWFRSMEREVHVTFFEDGERAAAAGAHGGAGEEENAEEAAAEEALAAEEPRRLTSRDDGVTCIGLVWSAGGERLLMLCVIDTEAKWIVWDRASDVLVVYAAVQIDRVFVRQWLPFWDAYVREIQPWSWDASAFCYSDAREGSFLQRVPSSAQLRAEADAEAARVPNPWPGSRTRAVLFRDTGERGTHDEPQLLARSSRGSSFCCFAPR